MLLLRSARGEQRHPQRVARERRDLDEMSQQRREGRLDHHQRETIQQDTVLPMIKQNVVAFHRSYNRSQCAHAPNQSPRKRILPDLLVIIPSGHLMRTIALLYLRLRTINRRPYIPPNIQSRIHVLRHPTMTSCHIHLPSYPTTFNLNLAHGDYLQGSNLSGQHHLLIPSLVRRQLEALGLVLQTISTTAMHQQAKVLQEWRIYEDHDVQML